MTLKQQVLDALERLPDQPSLDEVIDRLYLVYKVEQGLQQVRDGDVIPHAEARQRLSRWLR